MFCSISGEVPTQPVVSTKSGHVFEKRLIEKYLADEGKCPVTAVFFFACRALAQGDFSLPGA